MADDSADNGLLTERRGEVLRLVINRPEKRNALSRSLLKALEEAADAHSQDETLKLAIVTGAGDRSFAAGGDLHELSTVRDQESAAQVAEDSRRALDALRSFPVPVVAALNGDALGGGAELAAACDFRVAAAHARIGFIQGRLAISTAWGGGVDLLQIVGPSVGLRLLCRNELLSAADASAIGLVDLAATPGETLEAAVERFCAPILELAPQVLRTFKALCRGHRRGEPRSNLEALENRNFAENWVHPDHWAAADAILSRRTGR